MANKRNLGVTERWYVDDDKRTEFENKRNFDVCDECFHA